MSEQNATLSQDRTVVVDLGKKKRRQVKRLQKGGGPLMGRLQELISEMRTDGQLRENVDTVVVVVEKKGKKSFILPR